jgi:ferredoxin
MVTLYFSGTGNSKYIAEYFSEEMDCENYSIEEKIDFKKLINSNDTIAFCYPSYGSCVPLIMRQFILEHKKELSGKKIIIFSTQLMFSGDGARVLIDLLEDVDFKVIYAEHFNMPNNICNLPIFPNPSKKKMEKYVQKSNKKIDKICKHIRRGAIRKRGFNIISKYLGLLSQRIYFKDIEIKAMKDVRINQDCILCGKCIRICPMNNLEEKDNWIEQKGNCTLCYRCVNKCPVKAITVLYHKKVKQQYSGFAIRSGDVFK